MKLIMENWKTFLNEQASDRDKERARKEEEKADDDRMMEDLCKYDYVIYATLDNPRLSASLLKKNLTKAGASGELILRVINLLEGTTGMSLEELASSALGRYARKIAKGAIRGACHDYK